MTPARCDLLDTIRAELKRDPPAEGYIKANGWHVAGLCEAGRVTINPMPELVQLLAHEMLHRLHPGWGEKRVETEARRLRASMDDRQIRSLYRLYQRCKRPRKTTVNLDED